MTARTRCGRVTSRECSELLYDKKLPLKLKEAVYNSYVRPAKLYGSEAWCLKENEMGILQRTERNMVIAMCEVQLKDRKRFTYLILMLCLNETIDQFAIANSVHWYGHVMRREYDHVLRRALDFEVEGQRKNRRPTKELEAKERMGGQRKNGRPKKERETKEKKEGQRKKGRPKKEREAKEGKGGLRRKRRPKKEKEAKEGKGGQRRKRRPKNEMGPKNEREA